MKIALQGHGDSQRDLTLILMTDGLQGPFYLKQK
jgi:hypothetical protein